MGKLRAMVLLGPVDQPLGQSCRGGGAAIDRQARGGDGLVEPRIARQRIQLQHEHAAGARRGDVVLQFPAVPGNEIVGVFDHHQPAAAEHGHGRKLVEHVPQQRVAARESPQREIAFFPAEHGRPEAHEVSGRRHSG